jgi:uncharacterized protein DUF4440
MLRSRRAAVSLLLWTLCAGMPVSGQTSSAAQEEADHESLRALRAVYERAIRENQLEPLQPYLHTAFHGVMVTGRAVNGFGDLQRFWNDIKGLIGPGGTYTSTLNPERSVILGDIALARGTTADVVKTGDGDEFRFTTLWSATLQREAGAWKLRYVQGTMDPVSNPFVREFSRRAIIRFTSAALIAGIVVGMAFGVIWQKRRTRRVM